MYRKDPKQFRVDSVRKCGSAKNEVNMTYQLYGAAFVWTSCVLLGHVQGRYTGSERASEMYTRSERAAMYVHCRSERAARYVHCRSD